ncbi:hypothetical protein Z043_108172 [Scleropages formosus]|uniref:Polycomb group RING finger protein 6-like n=1 Tax=Scleropages formosus TaxID=113540 RepID=A0A0P7XCE7_SCLFO|nr:hypothetical protein Z043_108172 [Scleropages formosus]
MDSMMEDEEAVCARSGADSCGARDSDYLTAGSRSGQRRESGTSEDTDESCIVKHFFYSNRCPNCNVVVHQTQPLYNIRLDRQLQDIVYKMVPNLEEKERERMHDFYKERGLEVPKPVAPTSMTAAKPSKQKRGPLPQSVFTIPSELDVSLMLEFPLERKYVRVSGEATIRHVELFIRRKMELNNSCQVDVVCGDHILDRYQSLREVQNFMGESALQDGLLVLHFGLVQSPRA